MTKVIKRDGKEAEFNESKIELAILKAMAEIDYSTENIQDIVESIVEQIENEESEIITVEEIQEIVIGELYSEDRKLGKIYNDYRNKKNISRQNRIPYKLLNEEFLSKYKHLPEPFPTDMSKFVYYRTYSRFLSEERRREHWWETVARVVDYNCSLAPTAREEAEELYDNIFNLRQFPSGRTFWVGGTEVSKKYPMANYNCAFNIIDNFSAYVDSFYLLLIGAGVGFRVLPEDIEKLPKIRTDIEIIDGYFQSKPKNQRKELTEFTIQNNILRLIIGDSKEGWVQALDIFFKVHYDNFFKPIDTILIDYDNIRPAGEILKTFGGYSSGHQSMKIMLNKISRIIQNCTNKVNDTYVKLKSIDCMDIANILGENVVSGGVRRTAEIILFDKNDNEILTSKNSLYTMVNGEWIANKEIIHRSMSNNSIYYKEKPTREQLKWQIEQMRFNGEPAFVNSVAIEKRRENGNGVNPCGEILLDSKGLCNLTEINIMAFVDELNILDLKRVKQAQRLSARMSYRMTCVEYELNDWDVVNKRDRLIGCSISGWQDMINVTKMSSEDQSKVLQQLKHEAINASNKLADELCQNRPLLHTTIKPSGTISLLPNVSAGIHYSHSEYYIRRIRMNANDPIVFALKDMGYSLYPEVGQDKETCTTMVVEFPMKAPKGKTKYNVSAIEQLENYKMFMEYYVEHNVSITVTVRDNEWKEVEQWMWDNWDYVVAVSFLPLSDAMYQLMPYEEITEEQYIELCKKTPKFNPSLLSKYEKGEDYEINESECSGGGCPIR